MYIPYCVVFSYAKKYFQSISVYHESQLTTTECLFTIGKFNCHLYILCGAHTQVPPFYANFFQTRKLCIHKPFDHQATNKKKRTERKKKEKKREKYEPKTDTRNICTIYFYILVSTSVFVHRRKKNSFPSRKTSSRATTHDTSIETKAYVILWCALNGDLMCAVFFGIAGVAGADAVVVVSIVFAFMCNSEALRWRCLSSGDAIRIVQFKHVVVVHGRNKIHGIDWTLCVCVEQKPQPM